MFDMVSINNKIIKRHEGRGPLSNYKSFFPRPQVSAMDRDEGANGRVRYSIAMGDDNRDFTISEDGGVIRVAKNLNFERKFCYHLTIRSEDCAAEVGETPRSDTTQVTITVLDINDNAPVFLDSPYLAHVMENMVPPGGGFVIQVRTKVIK